MSTNWTCPRCGATTYHFSKTRNALVCDGGCGTIVKTEAERNAEILYEKNMVLAKQHLQVGNWDDAKRLIKPFCSSRPADKQLYLMLLVAVTKCYTDFLTQNDSERKEAAEYWDKLKRLGCVNSTMRDYARRRKEYMENAKSLLMTKIGTAVITSILITLITICMLSSGSDGGGFFVILSVASWIISVKYIKKVWINSDIDRNSNSVRGDNPFL